MINKETIKPLTILETDFVKVTPTLRNVDIRYTKKPGHENRSLDILLRHNEEKKAKRIDKDTYKDPKTNEPKEYAHKEERTANESTFFRTRRELNWLILNNFQGAENEFFLTLTYKNKMENPKKLSSDFRNFLKRLNSHFHNMLSFEYILVREPHMSDSWHMHILLKYQQIKGESIISKSEIEPVLKDKWHLGLSHVEDIVGANQLSAYLTAHLSNIVIDENGEDSLEIDPGTMTTKNILKNTRLPMYPMGLKIYSSSKGIQKPHALYMPFGSCMAEFEATHKVNYDASFKLFNERFAILQRHIQLEKQ